MIMEYMQADLSQLIRASRKANALLMHKDIRWIMFQVLVGLDHIHSCQLVHRDIKPDNILINDKLDLKIAD